MIRSQGHVTKNEPITVPVLVEWKSRDTYLEGRQLFQGKRLFEILLTGSGALNILFYCPNKSKNYHTKETEHGLIKCSKFGSLINFQSLNHHWSFLLDQIPLQLDRERIKKTEDGEIGVKGGIILNITIKRGAIIRGRRLMEGWLLFEGIRYNNHV